MRADILSLINNNISGAQDNLARARMQFGRMTPEQLAEEYGESGRTCGSILAEYEAHAINAKAMKAWFEVNTKQEK